MRISLSGRMFGQKFARKFWCYPLHSQQSVLRLQNYNNACSNMLKMQRRKIQLTMCCKQGADEPVPLSEVANQQLGLKETVAIDKLISELLASKSQEELVKKIGKNVDKFDRKFWLRLATRNDSATEAAEKQQLQSMADSVMVLLDALVKQTEDQLQKSSAVLQDILKTAADEKGEWLVPLPDEKEAAVKTALKENESKLDEAFLSNAYAYMQKAREDKIDGMVSLIQKVLQLYAAMKLDNPNAKDVDAELNELILLDASVWKSTVVKKADAGQVGETSLKEALQRKMEGTILGLQSGSYTQRVQAEYLKELEKKVKEAFKEISARNFKGFGEPH
eukprot:TRINITY_DN20322_c0_g2_i2.p1 TRINITY_DN20322_c0_g2~~TRINITY_DN20322_c0_g2_i2.p1  ORF type:complete len:378 (+),score=52.57 TRINITY_DN20322_c0_g2_i2:130-1134(+)